MDCASEPNGIAAGRPAAALALATLAGLALAVPGEAQAQTVTTFYQQCGAGEPLVFRRHSFRRPSRHGVHHGRKRRGILANERRRIRVRFFGFRHPAGRDFPEQYGQPTPNTSTPR